jgi:integrase/recombinase XerD
VRENASGPLPQYLTREQVRDLIGAARTERDRMLLRVLWETGGRISEVLALVRSDVDVEHRQIRLETLKRKRDKRRKAEQVFRWIPVQPALVADLAAWFLSSGLAEGVRLFGISRITAYRKVRDAAARVGMVARGGRRPSPHILRHSFAVNLLSQGVPMPVVKEMLGHASILNTMEYSRVAPEEARTFLKNVEW